MAKAAGIIEINGQRYDAATGKVVGAAKRAASVVAGGGQVLDGFMRRPIKTVQPKVMKTVKPVSAKLNKPAQAVHRQSQRAETLMRSVVGKPKLKSQPKPAEQPARRRQTVINAKRLFRAKTILRSPRISHFTPKAKEGKSIAAEGEVLPRSAAARAANPTKALTRPVPSLVASISHNQLERLLDHALLRADAHKKALKTRARGPLKYVARMPRWLAVSIILLLVVLVGGLYAWQNVPELSLKVAASRAHVEASTPAYIPDGYSLASPVQYDDGAVKMQLTSAGDNSKTVTITQQSSNLDSQSLKDSVVPANTPVQTSDVNGTPLYIYGKQNNAVFQKGNTEVKIDNKANLPPNELTNIAKGLTQ